MLHSLDIHTILNYYAILCLILSPISIWLFITLYRKTDVMDKVDKFIDKLLGIKEQPAEEQKKPEEPEKKEISKRGNLEMSGVAIFNLQVGDIYYCRKSTQHFSENIHEIVWSTDNEFIGEIDEDGLLTTKHTGELNVFCARKDNPFDSAVQAYNINVFPMSEDWFAQWLLDAINNKSKKSDILAKNIKQKLVSENPFARTITYEYSGPAKRLILEFDEKDLLDKGVFILRDCTKENLDALKVQLNERFEKVKLQNEETEIWIHRIIDEAHNEVDVYAMLKIIKGKDTILGFSHTWREFGEIEEFLLNINMASQNFKACIDLKKEELKLEKENPVSMRKGEKLQLVKGISEIPPTVENETSEEEDKTEKEENEPDVNEETSSPENNNPDVPDSTDKDKNESEEKEKSPEQTIDNTEAPSVEETKEEPEMKEQEGEKPAEEAEEGTTEVDFENGEEYENFEDYTE